MRIAVFGDVHSNLEALEAVLADAKVWLPDSYLCLGDVVGYGANPRECVARVRELGCPVVKGNHDEQAAIDDSLEGFGPLAEVALNWTRRHLVAEERSWLNDLPYELQFPDFQAVHATLDRPQRWGYIFNERDAAECMREQTRPICFFGHTHALRFFVEAPSNQPRTVLSQLTKPIDRVRWGGLHSLPVATLLARPGKKYLLNAGSVGQPRDGDWRAGYLIYDTEMRAVVPRRVEYDLERAQAKILEADLPPHLAKRLGLGK